LHKATNDGNKHYFKFAENENGYDFNGEFNGEDVHIYIGTNSNKVYRVMVCDANTRTEGDIKTRFNRLVRQFENNKRYKSLSDNQSIDDDVDISYEMLVNNKHFDATFHQVHTKDEIKEMRQMIYDNYNTIVNELTNSVELSEVGVDLEMFKKDKTDENIDALVYLVETMYMMSNAVWFRIQSYGSEYYLSIFYDNLSNRPNGEDL
ncbi:MAG: hypothetical protein J6X10_00845, partial [Bacteroidales bacterium]|nr:hypothetical protein [Bacteroidales bacterium]